MSAPTLFTSGDRLGKYVVDRLLGRGGMGEVYLVSDPASRTRYAAKVLQPEMTGDPAYLEKFLTEGRLACRIHHANVVGVIDAAVDPATGLAYMVMEYIDGGSVEDLIRRGERPAWEWAAAITLAVAEALTAAERAGIVHRDIKPDNIMLTSSGGVKLADLGIARRNTEPESPDEKRFGTPAYISPEQCRRGSVVDGRSDIYSLGATLFELLTGRPPYSGNTPLEVVTAMLQTPVPDPRRFNPELPASISVLTMRMLAKDPAQRPRNARELIRELHKLPGVGAPVPEPKVSALMEWFTPDYRTRKRVLCASILVAAALVIALVPLPPPGPRPVETDPRSAEIKAECSAAIRKLTQENRQLEREIAMYRSYGASPEQRFLKALFLRFDLRAARLWYDIGVRPADRIRSEWFPLEREPQPPTPEYIREAADFLEERQLIFSENDFERLIAGAVHGEASERKYALHILTILAASAHNRASWPQPLALAEKEIAQLEPAARNNPMRAVDLARLKELLQE